MAILAMDTATDALGVAIGEGTDLIASSTFRVVRGHSRILQPAIAHLLSHTGMTPADLTSICVGIGPGSYTGVRLAVSTAKAMAMALDIPLIPISTLAGIAQAASMGAGLRNALIMPLLFARRGRAFGALYQAHGTNLHGLQKSLVMNVADWCKTATKISKEQGLDIIVVHDFVPKNGVEQELDILPNPQVVPLRTVASTLGHALITLAHSGKFELAKGEQIHEIVPEYALEVEAEVKRREREMGH